jgi:phage-related protein
LPETQVHFYADEKGRAPVLEWLKESRWSNARAYAKCVAAIQELASRGHELRRPLVDHLGSGLYELRVRVGRENYRILYFFHGRNVTVLAHALMKEDVIPRSDIDRALNRKALFEKDPARHTYAEEGLDG